MIKIMLRTLACFALAVITTAASCEVSFSTGSLRACRIISYGGNWQDGWEYYDSSYCPVSVGFAGDTRWVSGTLYADVIPPGGHYYALTTARIINNYNQDVAYGEFPVEYFLGEQSVFNIYGYYPAATGGGPGYPDFMSLRSYATNSNSGFLELMLDTVQGAV